MSWKSSFFIRALLRETKRVGKDHTLILSLLFAPIFYAFFYGSIYLNKTESEVDIVVVDYDMTSLSRQYARMIDQTQTVNVKLRTASLQEAKALYLNTEVQGVLVIERNFERQLKRLQSTDVGLILNTSRFLPSNDINETVSEISLMIGAGIRLEYYEMHGDNDELSLVQAMPIDIEDHAIFVTPSTYGGFLLPGLLLLILQQIFLIGLSESMAREREKGTVGEWLELSKGRIWPAILGKGFFFMILFSAYALFFHIINFSVLDLGVGNSPLLLAFLIAVFYTVLLFFGTFFGSLFSKEIWALQFFAFSSYPFFLLSGYTWPLYAMNDFLQGIAFLIPSTPMLEAYSALVFKDASFSQILKPLLHLAGLGVLYAGLAYWRIHALKLKEKNMV